MTPKEFCSKHGACEDGAAFAAKHTTLADVWDNCHRPDWMLWMLDKQGTTDKYDINLRLFACWCATSTPGCPKLTDPRSINAITVSLMYAAGIAQRQELDAAQAAALDAAWDAAQAAAQAAALDAAWDAAQAAARNAAQAAAQAAARDAAQAALAAALDAAWDAAWDAAQAAARAAQAAHLRRLVANPFQDAAQAAARAAQAAHLRRLVANPFQETT